MARFEVIKRGIADRTEKNRGAGVTGRKRRVRKGSSVAAQSCPANRVLSAVNLVSARFADELQDANGLCGDFRSYAITWQNGNRQTHERNS